MRIDILTQPEVLEAMQDVFPAETFVAALHAIGKALHDNGKGEDFTRVLRSLEKTGAFQDADVLSAICNWHKKGPE